MSFRKCSPNYSWQQAQNNYPETTKQCFSHGKFVGDGECNSWQLSSRSGYFFR